MKNGEVEGGLLSHGVVHGGLEEATGGGEKHALAVDEEEVGGVEVRVEKLHGHRARHGDMVGEEERGEESEEKREMH